MMIDADVSTDPRSRQGFAWMERPSRGLRIAKAAFLTLVVLLMVFPFISVIATSFASDEDILQVGGYVLFPRHPTLNAYRVILQNGIVAHALMVSVGVTVVGTIASMVLTVAMAFGLSRRVRGLRPVLFLVLFTMLFTPGIIPSYLVVKQLGLLNNYAALILPVMINAFNLVVLRQFFMEIPKEIMDSARIDGAGEIGTLRHIVLPLSKPVLAVVGLFYTVSYWNAFFNALLYLNSNESWPLQLVVRMYVLQGMFSGGAAYASGDASPMVPQSLQMAVVMIATIPIIVVYPFLQRYFTSGVLSGAIKG
jgi:ABC-type glycerol-3-phosphate transport system permease component